jgi:WASH complex subunit 7
VIQADIALPLSLEIETNLRINTHIKHLPHMTTADPRASHFGPLRNFLDIPAISVLGVLFDIKKEVTRYLDRNFYNLVTVSIPDSLSYREMKILAKDNLGLNLFDSFLPMGCLDQGMDLLEIMRNIDLFVTQYSYNMNMQQFIEFRPNMTASTKHLHTLTIRSIMASIRQHGLGVVNTTVNYTYQYLSQKFNLFSQYLFDDYLRGYLSRETRWYKKHKNEASVNNVYPYDRAMQFVKDMKRLGDRHMQRFVCRTVS